MSYRSKFFNGSTFSFLSMGHQILRALVVLIGIVLATGQALAQGFPAVIELDSLTGSNGFSVELGRNNSDRVTSAAGDINGDGIDDFILGAGAEGNFAGKIYVIFGKNSGFTSPLELFDAGGLSFLDGTNGFVINGVATGDEAGASVSTGDINGDGVADVIIGAPFASPSTGAFAGTVHVVFGKSEAYPADGVNLSTLTSAFGFTIKGEVADDRAGTSVASGDINGDGVADVIIGAGSADPGARISAGTTYVLYGHTGSFGLFVDLSSLDGTTGFAINGVAASDEAGHSVSSGDVNGDGIGDVMIGAPFGGGAAYVVFGSTTAFPTNLELTSLNGTTGTTINGGQANSQLGSSVASGGDLNGDGFDDVIIGAPFHNTGSPVQGGAAYILFGSGSSLGAVFDVSTLDGSNGFVVHGLTESAQLGSAGGFGDINGDGRADAFITAPREDTGTVNDAGVVYVVFGQTSGFGSSFDLTSLDGTNGFAINGGTNFGSSGATVGAGDLNGDGTQDVVLSSRSRKIGSTVFGISAPAAPTTVFTSLLPAARGGYIGGPLITVFFSANNAGANEAQNCKITVPLTAPVTLSFQQTDAANAPIGSADQAFNLAPGQTRSFILAFTANATSTGEDVFPDVVCNNATVDAIPGVNTVFLSIDVNPVPDVLSIGATLDGNGIITVPVDGVSFMTAAATNIGVGGSAGSQDVEVAVSATTGNANLDIRLTVCELDAASNCLVPATTPDVAATIGSGASFFAVFVFDNSSGGIPLDPANARVFLSFIEFGAPGGAITRSVTSAAVTVQ